MKRIVFLLLLLSVYGAYANNIRVTDATRLAAPNRDMVAFTLSWDNSWRVGGAPGNHDAAWVFVKLRPCDGGPWQHGLLSTTMGNHTIGGDLEAVTPISLANRFGVTSGGATESNHLGHNTGIMLRRSSFGKGHIVSVRCTLKLVNTVAEFDPAVEYSVRVFGIEMVRVNEGAFVLGDVTSFSRFNTTVVDATVESNVLSAATIGGNSIFTDNIPASTTANLPAAYPKGFSTFYCMKYEISQGMFADFMNTVDGYAGGPQAFFGVNRNNLTVSAGVSSSTPNRAQNFMNWNDLCAYLDWAALRPMTELEFEKACRGTVGAIPGEFAWGTNSFQYGWFYSTQPDGTETCFTRNANLNIAWTVADNFGLDAGHQSENVFRVSAMINPAAYSPTWALSGTLASLPERNSGIDSTHINGMTPPNVALLANLNTVHVWPIHGVHSWGGVHEYGPVGCGIFARDATQSRTQTGASYWGIMEMSGNVGEQCVGVQASSTGFTGLWGNGYLSAGGADVTGWDLSTRAVRGGSYGDGPRGSYVSSRLYSNITSTNRDETLQFGVEAGNANVPRLHSAYGQWRGALNNGYNGGAAQKQFRLGICGGRGVR